MPKKAYARVLLSADDAQCGDELYKVNDDFDLNYILKHKNIIFEHSFTFPPGPTSPMLTSDQNGVDLKRTHPKMAL